MWLHHKKPCCVCSCCTPLLAPDFPWKVSLEIQQRFSSNGLCYNCFLIKQKVQLIISPVTSLGVSGGAARERGGIGEPQVHFVICSVPFTSFWDSTWRQLGATLVMVTSIRIMTLVLNVLGVLLWQQAALVLWQDHIRNSASLVSLLAQSQE